MEQKRNLRQLAVKILTAITYHKTFLNEALLTADNLEPAERAYVQRVVRGVVEHLRFLDALLQRQSKIPLKKLRDSDLNILRLGLYEMIHLDGIPNYASVNECVKLMKRSNPQLQRYANALLRNFSTNLQDILDQAVKDMPLGIRYSHPDWLVDHFVQELGEEGARALLQANNLPVRLSLRVNTLRTTRVKVMAELANEGIEAVPSKWVEEGILIPSDGDAATLLRLDLFKNGDVTVQDESSMLAGHLLDPQPGERVLDLCAAPGGKTTHLAQLMEDRGEVDARDVSYEKLLRIKENLDRLGIHSVRLSVGDALEYAQESGQAYDRVLLDAPCSGLGIIRRKPDIRWQRSPGDLAQLASIQSQMLENAAKYVKIGGVMVYSTCTLAREENDRVIDTFLRNHPEFRAERSDKISSELFDAEFMKLAPHIHGTDGFFACRMRRVSS